MRSSVHILANFIWCTRSLGQVLSDDITMDHLVTLTLLPQMTPDRVIVFRKHVWLNMDSSF